MNGRRRLRTTLHGQQPPPPPARHMQPALSWLQGKIDDDNRRSAVVHDPRGLARQEPRRQRAPGAAQGALVYRPQATHVCAQYARERQSWTDTQLHGSKPRVREEGAALIRRTHSSTAAKQGSEGRGCTHTHTTTQSIVIIPLEAGQHCAPSSGCFKGRQVAATPAHHRTCKTV